MKISRSMRRFLRKDSKGIPILTFEWNPNKELIFWSTVSKYAKKTTKQRHARKKVADAESWIKNIEKYKRNISF